MWLPIMGLITGLLLGSLFTFDLPGIFARYLSIAVLASLDSLLGGWRSVQEDKFDGAILLSGFFINAITAMLLVFVGTLLNLPLELAAVIAFGLRIFNNVGYIRRGIVQQMRNNRLARKNRREQGDLFNEAKRSPKE